MLNNAACNSTERASMRCELLGSQVDQLVSQLDAPQRGTRREAFEALVRTGSAAVPAVSSLLKDGTIRGRIAAAHLLAAIQDREAIPALMVAVWDPVLAVRRAAIAALGTMRASEAVTVLVEMARSPVSACREDAVRALIRIADPQSIPTLSELLVGGGPTTLLIEALGATGQPAAVPALAQALASSPATGVQAVTALSRIRHPEAAAALARGLDRAGATRAARLGALLEMGEVAVPALVDALGELPASARWAAKVLKKMGGRAVRPLGDALTAGQGNPESEVSRRRRLRIVQLLGGAGSAATQPLLRTLGDPVAELRMTAALALGQVGQSEATGALRVSLHDSALPVRAAAAISLVECGATDAALAEPLISSLGRSLPADLRIRGSRALAKLAPEVPCGALHSALAPLEGIARGFLRPAIERAAAREAIRAIQNATARLADLPLPARAHNEVSTLPVPAAAPTAPPADSLPRPQAGPECEEVWLGCDFTLP